MSIQALTICSQSTYLTNFEKKKKKLVFSLNNPQNSEMKICEKYEVHMLSIIIIFIYNFKIKKRIHFLKS